MHDPGTTGYLANMARYWTTSILKIVRRRGRQADADTPREEALQRTGDVTIGGNVHATNLVTGVQINPIVQVYRTGGGVCDEAAYRAALRRYLEWLGAAMSRVVLRGIKRGDQQAVELSLHDVYVPLAAEALPEARESLRRGLRSTPPDAELLASHMAATRITMQGLLAQGDRLAVIGAPGCGKTTVLQHIACTLAAALGTDQPDLAAARLGLTGTLPLPIYVPLSLYADHRRRFADHPEPHQRQLATFINHYLGRAAGRAESPRGLFCYLAQPGSARPPAPGWPG